MKRFLVAVLIGLCLVSTVYGALVVNKIWLQDEVYESIVYNPTNRCAIYSLVPKTPSEATHHEFFEIDPNSADLIRHYEGTFGGEAILSGFIIYDVDKGQVCVYHNGKEVERGTSMFNIVVAIRKHYDSVTQYSFW